MDDRGYAHGNRREIIGHSSTKAPRFEPRPRPVSVPRVLAYRYVRCSASCHRGDRYVHRADQRAPRHRRLRTRT